MEVPKTQDSAALTKMWGDMKFTGLPGSFNMQELSLKLDQSTFSGNFVIQGSDNPQLAYDFEIDSLNLDHYSSADEEDSGGNSEVENNDPLLAFGIFFALPGSGDLRIGKLVASGLTVTDISVKTTADIKRASNIPN